MNRALLLLNAVFLFSAQAADAISFQRNVIDANFMAGYQVSVADIDADGKPDVIALATTPSRLVWYKNPEWNQFAITTKTPANIDLAPHDIDGDGDQDVALAYEFSLPNSSTGGAVCWLECPENPRETQEWILHAIDAVPTSHRIRWADITGDGKPELLNLPIIGVGSKPPEYAIGVQFKAYTIPTELAAAWHAQVIDSTLCMAHGIAMVQWDDDAASEILTASFQGVSLFNLDSESQTFSMTRLGEGHAEARPKQGSSEVALGLLHVANRRFIAAIEPWHGSEVVVYIPGPSETQPWTRAVIDDTLVDGHALACADFNDDGNDEIIASGRGGERNLCLYRYDASAATWQKQIIDAGEMGGAGVFLADIDADGRRDIVAIGTATNNVVWYQRK